MKSDINYVLDGFIVSQLIVGSYQFVTISVFVYCENIVYNLTNKGCLKNNKRASVTSDKQQDV